MYKSARRKKITEAAEKNCGPDIPDSCKLVKSLDDNINILKEVFHNDETIMFRVFGNQHSAKIRCCAVFACGMVDKKAVSDNIIKPVMFSHIEEATDPATIDTLVARVLDTNEIEKQVNMDQIAASLLYGDTILLVDGYEEVLAIDTKGWQHRAIQQPVSEILVRGPREGFVESLAVNITLLRRRIINPDLKFQFMEIGLRTKTKTCICYIESLASKEILDELVKRLKRIEIDGILDSGYIQEMIKDSPFSPFNTVGDTERPDVVAANLLEGRIALICDGSPFVLTVPYIFIEYFQTNEDYYNNFIFGTINRIIRITGFFLSTSVPAIYVAVTTFHQEILPTPLLLSISAAREGVPFPTIVEAIFMAFVFEVLREAGIRLPTPVGEAISIVGALVLGDAAVTARLVSAPMVVVTALTGISSFLVPKLMGPLIVTRLAFLLLSASLGLYGYIFGVIGLLICLMSMRSFGIPYMLDVMSINKQDMKDTAIRAPWWYMYYRPKLIADRNSARKKDARRGGIKS